MAPWVPCHLLRFPQHMTNFLESGFVWKTLKDRVCFTGCLHSNGRSPTPPQLQCQLQTVEYQEDWYASVWFHHTFRLSLFIHTSLSSFLSPGLLSFYLFSLLLCMPWTFLHSLLQFFYKTKSKVLCLALSPAEAIGGLASSSIAAILGLVLPSVALAGLLDPLRNFWRFGSGS